MADILLEIWRAIELAVGWVFSPEWLPPGDFKLYKWLFVPGFGYGFVIIGFGIYELIRPHQKRTWSRDTLLSGTYLLFAGKITFYSLLVVPLFRNAWVYWGLPSLHLDVLLPEPVYAIVAVLVVTFCAYWSHRWMHEVPAFWHIHKIHHSARNLNWSAVYQQHFLETLIHAPLAVMATLLLGTELVAPFGIIFKFIDVLAHSNIRWPFPMLAKLTYVICTPEAHRIHHSTDPRHFNSNYGNTFMLWDQLFGTFKYDPEHPPTAYGVDEDVPPSFIRQQILPFVWIARDLLKSRGTQEGAVELTPAPDKSQLDSA